MKADYAGMTWDLCEPISGSPSLMRVSINMGEARIYIPAAVFDAAGGPTAVQLLYSRDERSVAIRPVDQRDPSALMMTRRTDKGVGRWVSAGMLCRRLSADGYSGTLTVPVQWHPDGLLWGDLTMATKRPGKAKGGGV